MVEYFAAANGSVLYDMQPDVYQELRKFTEGNVGFDVVTGI
jgi:hypothetical protein